LERLASGGPTDGQLVEIYDAWTVPVADGFCVVYARPFGKMVGVRVLRTSSADYPLFLNADGSVDVNDAEDFGSAVADYVIAEPLGSRARSLKYDREGVGWWGEPPTSMIHRGAQVA